MRSILWPAGVRETGERGEAIVHTSSRPILDISDQDISRLIAATRIARYRTFRFHRFVIVVRCSQIRPVRIRVTKVTEVAWPNIAQIVQ